MTFSTIGSRPLAAEGLIKALGVNAGRVFYSDGRLNVIFGELQSNYRKKNVYGQRSEDYTPRRQGSRSKATEQKWILVARPGLEFHSTNGGDTRNDWVVIDTAVAGSEVLAAPTAHRCPAAASGIRACGAAPAPSPPAIVAAPAPVPAAAAAPAAAAEPVPRTGTSSADLEQRLRKLKDLRDKGLISEEAYRAKMQELLSEL